MDLNEFKLQTLGIDKSKLGKVYSFVDFGNVNKWFGKDVWGWNDYKLSGDEKLIIDIEKLSFFLDLFSDKKFFYYGFDNRNKSSLHMSVVAGKNGFKSVTKPIQWIRHYLTSDEESIYGNSLLSDMIRADEKGNFILIPKCNFDVEICLDIVRTQEK